MKRIIYGFGLLALGMSLAVPITNYFLAKNFFSGFIFVVLFTVIFVAAFSFLMGGLVGSYDK